MNHKALETLGYELYYETDDFVSYVNYGDLTRNQNYYVELDLLRHVATKKIEINHDRANTGFTKAEIEILAGLDF